MKKFYYIIIFMALFTGCEDSDFNIYKELEISAKDKKKSDNLDFLKDLVVHKISFKDDQLTPDISDGLLFGKTIISKIKLTKYFVYNKNSTFEHRSSIFVDLNPKMIVYINNYSDEKARIIQIQGYKPPPDCPRPARKVFKKSNDMLPNGLLPPRLPDLSIGVDTPVVPEISAKPKNVQSQDNLSN